MKLHHLRLRGITEAFPNEVCVDFDGLGEGLIAIVGENGAGKSTLIGSVFAALFRQLPGQKRSLYDFATHHEPEIDLTFSVNGAGYRSLLKIDPEVHGVVWRHIAEDSQEWDRPHCHLQASLRPR
jgi:DNA repair exonuclease SbcCD ATPase subunit